MPLLSQCRWSGQRHPHCIEAELISALGMGTNLDVAAADQSRPSATRAAKLIDPMRRSSRRVSCANCGNSRADAAPDGSRRAPPSKLALAQNGSDEQMFGAK